MASRSFGPRDHVTLAELLMAGDEKGAERLLTGRRAAGASVSALHLELVAPAMAEVGEAWASGRIDVAEEHRATSTLLRLLPRVAGATPTTPARGRVLLSTVPGERHGLPVTILAELFREAGFDVVDLGADCPIESLVHAVRHAGRLCAVGLSASTTVATAAEALAAVRAAAGEGVPLLLGGGAVADDAHARRLGADAWAPDGGSAVALVEELVEPLEHTVGTVSVDAGTGTVTGVGPGAADLLGVPPDRLVGRRWDEVVAGLAGDPVGLPAPVASAPRLVRLIAGGAVRTLELLPVPDLGRRPGVVVVRDVSDRLATERQLRAALRLRDERLAREEAGLAQVEIARQRLAFLADAGTVLAASVEWEDTLTAVATLGVPEVAAWSAVVAHDIPGREGVAVADAAGGRRVFRRPADRATDRLLSHRATLLLHDVDAERLDLLAPDDTARDDLLALRPGSVLVVALVVGGEQRGRLVWARPPGQRAFDTDDLALAVDVARLAALALEKGRLHRHRAEAIRALQETLLPPHLPDIPGVALAARYRPLGPTEVGGDFYDAYPVAEDEWAIAIGDVSGKGVTAAAVTGIARHALRTASVVQRRPSRVLATLNEAMCRQDLGERFCTVVFGVARPSGADLEVTLAVGGHPLPLLRRADGTVEAAGTPGSVVGLFDAFDATDVTVVLHAGDTLLLYTDGALEAGRDGDLFGERRLRETLAGCHGLGPAGVVATVDAAVAAFFAGEHADDTAFLALQVAPPPKG